MSHDRNGSSLGHYNDIRDLEGQVTPFGLGYKHGVLSTRRNPVDKIVLKLSGQEDTIVVPTIAALYPLLRI